MQRDILFYNSTRALIAVRRASSISNGHEQSENYCKWFAILSSMGSIFIWHGKMLQKTIDRVDDAERERSSLPEVFRTIPVSTSGTFWRRLVAFIGPGYLVATGYMDPGNWATALAGGSAFGYQLLAVALISNIMAILLQRFAPASGLAPGSSPSLPPGFRGRYRSACGCWPRRRSSPPISRRSSAPHRA